MLKRSMSLFLWIPSFLWVFHGFLLPAHGRESEDPRRGSIQELQKSLLERPDNVELLWEMARLYHEAGNKEESDEAKLNHYRSCQDYASQAIKRDDASAPAHFWLGICYGKEARIKGMFKGLSLSGKIKEEMTRVIELDPLYGDAGGHRAMGRMLTKLPRLFGGDLPKAREHLEEAVRLAPDFSTNHLYLAEVYLDLKEYDLALRHLTIVQEFPVHPGEEERLLEEKKKCKELMRDVPMRIKKRR